MFAGPDDAYKVYSLAILMAFEFVMVHSGLFMAAMPLKASIRLFIPLYGLFAFAFGHSMREGDYTIIILYLATVLNRMRFAFFNVSKSVKQRVVRQSMIALAVYFVLTVSVVCAESVIPSFSLEQLFPNRHPIPVKYVPEDCLLKSLMYQYVSDFCITVYFLFLISKLYGGNVLSLKEDAPEAILKK
ncbi:MAG: hypothetical protein ACLUHA_04915 [Bacteroides stercoris]